MDKGPVHLLQVQSYASIAPSTYSASFVGWHHGIGCQPPAQKTQMNGKKTPLDHRVAHTHTPDTRSKPVVRRSLFFGLLYLLGIFKVPQNAIRVDIRIDIRVIFSEYSLKPKRLTMNCIDSG